MAFDDVTRGRLQRFVAAARTLLTEEFSRQLQQDHGLDPSTGDIADLDGLAHLDDRRLETARILREILAHYLAADMATGGAARRIVLGRIVREQAFTILNRLAALRMMEARGILIESVARGYQSRGFQLYQRVANGALGETGETYRVFLLSVFDTFAADLPALFDRLAPQGRLFPREAALLAVLKEFDAPDLEPLWGEDETIGWVYQYFNSTEERKQMREDSAAPRNSRELAVRNQFFTPRYVVEFLTDNTLGCIWYEMNRGQTRLKDQCHYLVRRPNEIFLEPGEAAPKLSRQDNLSQEQLLQQVVHIAHRALEDPREIRLLDPACGSMHFGLYALDLFEVIYDEAWEIAHGSDEARKSSGSFASFVSSLVQYPAKADFLADVPRLIVEYNLHGIDIDPRATQIARLSLWLRAQRSWHQQGLNSRDRPRIRRSNIVCAEPMPGEEAFLDEFIEAHLSATPERKLLGQLVRRVFGAMRFVGETGSLLKIEDEISSAVVEAKNKWLISPKGEQGVLFSDDTAPLTHDTLIFDVTGIDDETFWDKAEERIYVALQSYATEAEHGRNYQRFLFTNDAARGFAFIDLCRKRYDVVLMNPPFGKCSIDGSDYFESNYSNFKSDIGIAFVDRFLAIADNTGCVGAITSRAFLASNSLKEWRANKLLCETPIRCLLDLGYGVLDDAMVEAAAYVVDATPTLDGPRTFIRALESREKASSVRHFFDSSRTKSDVLLFLHELGDFRSVPLSVICYWLPASLLHKLRHVPNLPDSGGAARHGLVTTDDWRFLRVAWEVGADSMLDGSANCWKPLAKGGEYQPFWDDIHICVDWSGNGNRLKTFLAEKRLKTQGSADWSPWLNHSEFYKLEGLTYPERTTSDFCPRVMPRDVIFSSTGQAIQFDGARDPAFAYLSGAFTRFFRLVVESFVGSGDNAFPGSAAKHYRSGLLNQLPAPLLDGAGEVRRIAEEGIAFAKALFASDETARNFCPTVRATSLHEMTRCAQDNFLDRALQVINNNLIIEGLVTTHFGLTADDIAVIDRIIGPQPLSYTASELTDTSTIISLWKKTVGEIVEFCIQNDGPRRQLTKKSFIADRKLELICHGLKLPPETVVEVIKSARCLDPQTIANAGISEVSFGVGCAFGRWDIRFATGAKASPVLPDPFTSLPVCPPGQLQNDRGLPITKEELGTLTTEGGWSYPIEVPWDGILVDDAGDPRDIEARVHQVLQIIWKDRWEAIEREVCEILGVRTLRDYFRRPSGFFADHLQRYSKSRRQAPIYWPLSTVSGRYTLWIYYHRLNDQNSL